MYNKDDIAYGQFYVTTYDGEVVNVHTDQTLAPNSASDWGPVKAVFCNIGDTETRATLRFDGNYGTSRPSATFRFSPFNVAGFIVEDGAIGYSVVADHATRPVNVGNMNGEASYSLIKEDFTLAQGAITIYGPNTFDVATGKTFTLTNESNLAGDLTITGGGTVAYAQGTMTLGANSSITVDAGSTMNCSSSLFMTGNATLTNNGNLALDRTVKFESHGIENNGSVTLGSNIVFDLSQLTPDENNTYTLFTGTSAVDLSRYEFSSYNITGVEDKENRTWSFGANGTITFTPRTTYEWAGTENTWTDGGAGWLNDGQEVEYVSGEASNVVFGASEKIGFTKDISLSSGIQVWSMIVQDNYSFTVEESGSLRASSIEIDGEDITLHLRNKGAEPFSLPAVTGTGNLALSEGAFTMGNIANSGKLVVDGGTLNLGSGAHTLSYLEISNGGVVTTTHDGERGCVSGDIAILAGGTFRIDNSTGSYASSYTFGWSNVGWGGTRSMTMQGESGKLAKLELNLQSYSCHIPVMFQMKGYSSVVSLPGNTGLLFGSGRSLLVEGEENHIDTIDIWSNVEINVASGGSLVVDKMAQRTGGSKGVLIKKGEGELCFAGSAYMEEMVHQGGSVTFGGATTIAGDLTMSEGASILSTDTVTFRGANGVIRIAQGGFANEGTVNFSASNVFDLSLLTPDENNTYTLFTGTSAVDLSRYEFSSYNITGVEGKENRTWSFGADGTITFTPCTEYEWAGTENTWTDGGAGWLNDGQEVEYVSGETSNVVFGASEEIGFTKEITVSDTLAAHNIEVQDDYHLAISDGSTLEANSIAIADGSTLSISGDCTVDIQELHGPGTLNIAAGTVLSNALKDAAEQKAVLSGEGTYVLAPGTSTLAVTLGEDWAGAVQLSGTIWDIKLDEARFGNKIEMKGLTTCFYALKDNESTTYSGTLVLTNPDDSAPALYVKNGFSRANAYYELSGAVEGDGAWRFYQTATIIGNHIYNNIILSGDISAWRGAFEVQMGFTVDLTLSQAQGTVNAGISCAYDGILDVHVNEDTTFNAAVTGLRKLTVAEGKSAVFNQGISASDIELEGELANGPGALLLTGCDNEISGEINMHAGSLVLAESASLNAGSILVEDKVALHAAQGSGISIHGNTVIDTEKLCGTGAKVALEAVNITTFGDYTIENMAISGSLIDLCEGTTLSLVDVDFSAATLDQAGYNVTLNTGTTLDLQGTNSVTASSLDMKDGSTMSFNLGAGEGSLLNLDAVLQTGVITVSLSGDLTHDCNLITLSDASQYDATLWTKENINVTGAGFYHLVWNDGVLSYSTEAHEHVDIHEDSEVEDFGDDTHVDIDGGGHSLTVKHPVDLVQLAMKNGVVRLEGEGNNNVVRITLTEDGSLQLAAGAGLKVGNIVSMVANGKADLVISGDIEISDTKAYGKPGNKGTLSFVNMTTKGDYTIENMTITGSVIDVGEGTTLYLVNVDIKSDTHITDAPARVFAQRAHVELNGINTWVDQEITAAQDTLLYMCGDTQRSITLAAGSEIVELTSSMFDSVTLTGTDLWLDMTGIAEATYGKDFFTLDFQDLVREMAKAQVDVENLHVYATLDGEKYTEAYSTANGGLTTTLYFQVPEPATGSLSLLALAALAARRRRK